MPQSARRHRPLQRPSATRPTANARGYDYRWQKASKAFLQRHPLCRPCSGAGRVKAADVVDHKIPHRGDDRLFWDETNWQPMCYSCHGAKSASERLS